MAATSEKPEMVQVKFFASLREDVGCAQLEVRATSLPELFAALEDELGAFKVDALRAENVRIAVNQTLVDASCEFQPGDEVAFLPPVTGG